MRETRAARIALLKHKPLVFWSDADYQNGGSIIDEHIFPLMTALRKYVEVVLGGDQGMFNSLGVMARMSTADRAPSPLELEQARKRHVDTTKAVFGYTFGDDFTVDSDTLSANMHAERCLESLLAQLPATEACKVCAKEDGCTLCRCRAAYFCGNQCRARDPDPHAPECVVKTCNKCGSMDSVKACSGCRRVYYCNGVCQKEDWPSHKKACAKTGKS